jgi:acetylglutamate kinase
MKTVLLKLSGKVLENFFADNLWIRLIVDLKSTFDEVVVVHGAGVKISEWSSKMGLKPRFFNGLRITDEITMEVVAAVQSGLLNSKLVSKLQANGINAVGLTGIDYNLFIAEKVNDQLGLVGNPVFTGEKDLFKTISSRVIPVFSSICRDPKGNLMNINADTFAKELSIAMNADVVFFLSDIKGVKLNNIVKNRVTESDISEGILNGQITDGMIPKLQNCLDLLNNGIKKVWIGNDLTSQNIKEANLGWGEMNDNKYKGTWIVQSGIIAV